MKLQNQVQKYLITPTLLNSWKYCLERGNLEDFVKTLNRETFEPSEAILRGFKFEDYMIANYEETKNGSYQVKVYKDVDNYVVYGKIDCLKAGVITDYKYTGSYEVGKFYNSYQTAIYMELVPEAYKMQYIISDNFNDKRAEEEECETLHIYKEEYYRENLKIDLREEINTFMNWLKQMNLLSLYQEKWKSKY